MEVINNGASYENHARHKNGINHNSHEGYEQKKSKAKK